MNAEGPASLEVCATRESFPSGVVMPQFSCAPRVVAVEPVEDRRLLSWSAYAQLVNQDQAAKDFSAITGKGVTVAVIDTGVDYTQPALGGGFGTGFKVKGGYDFYGNDADPMDDSGHGTNV